MTPAVKAALVKKLLKDPAFQQRWAREQIVVATVELASAIVEEPEDQKTALSQKVQAIKELMTGIELLLEEGHAADTGSQGKQNWAPPKSSGTVGPRAAWVGRTLEVAERHPEPLGEPSVELPKRPD